MKLGTPTMRGKKRQHLLVKLSLFAITALIVATTSFKQVWNRQALRLALSRHLEIFRQGKGNGAFPGTLLGAPLEEDVMLEWQLQSSNSSKSKGGTMSGPQNLEEWVRRVEEAEGARSLDGACWSMSEAELYLKDHGIHFSEALVEEMEEHELMMKSCAAKHPNLGGHLGSLIAEGVSEQEREVDCKYVIYAEHSMGVGNRLLGLVSAYLHALLTGRVFLVSRRGILKDLLCNPLKAASWWVPDDFPDHFVDNPGQHARMRALWKEDGSRSFPSAVWVYLGGGGYAEDDAPWYCEQGHDALESVPIIFHRTSIYFEPSLWLVPRFEARLQELFPQREVATLLARKLLFPANLVWEKITAIHKPRVLQQESVLGLQVRNFAAYEPNVTDRILDCISHFGLLPTPRSQEDKNATDLSPGGQRKVRRVILASLERRYLEDLENFYKDRPLVDGSEIVWEMHSYHGSEAHEYNQFADALMEMWLLALSDDLVISMQSTFGYIPMVLQGRTPYFLNIRGQYWANGLPACFKAWTSNPCMQDVPPQVHCPGSSLESKLQKKASTTSANCQDADFPANLLVLPLHERRDSKEQHLKEDSPGNL